MKVHISNQLHEIRKWLEAAEKAVNDCDIPKSSYLPEDVLRAVAKNLPATAECMQLVGDMVFRELKRLKG